MSQFDEVGPKVWLHKGTGALYLKSGTGELLVYLNPNQITSTLGDGRQVPFLEANPQVKTVVQDVKIDALNEGK